MHLLFARGLWKYLGLQRLFRKDLTTMKQTFHQREMRSDDLRTRNQAYICIDARPKGSVALRGQRLSK